MASAGRILIMPKGDWSAETEYEMLDLVFHNGASWLAKKNAVGIEPREENAEYWMKMCSSTDLTGYLKTINGFLPGQLGLGSGKGLVGANDYEAIIQARVDGDNYRNIRVSRPNEDETSDTWVQVSNCVEGNPTYHNLFGEHNLDLLNRYIDARIAEKMK